MISNAIEETILISNIKYIYPELPTKGVLRIGLAALSLSNQKGTGNTCYPMITGWNENPEVEFADFQWWTKCIIEESNFIIGNTIIPFAGSLQLYPEIVHTEPSVILKFKDGTSFRLIARNPERPIEVCVWDKGDKNFLQRKIFEYGYTPIPIE